MTVRQAIENLEMIGLNYPSWERTVAVAARLIRQGEKRKRLVDHLQAALNREVAENIRSRRKAVKQ